MIIQNLRLGFATNSSSSHSVVIIPDDLVGKVRDDGDQGGEFGWSFFTLSSPESKIRYLASQMFSAFQRQNNFREIVEKVVAVSKEFDETFHVSIPEDGVFDAFDLGYVDHQSVMSFRDYREDSHRALLQYFMGDNVVVLGGNDNCDEEDDENAIARAIESPISKYMNDDGGSVMTRTDCNALILFDPNCGDKLRLTSDGTDYTKATSPELVDLKITDYCDKGCNFCYQSSTVAGKHAPFERITKVIDMLAEMKVFEIAIGGGEPTSHPQFAAILQYAYTKGIVPNFTTFSDKWLINTDLVEAVKKYTGAIGVSVSNEKGLELFRSIQKHSGKSYWGITAQHVVGSVPLQVTLKLVEAARDQRVPLLLLGYKNVGFGASFKPRLPNDTEMSVMARLIVTDNNFMRLSVDTALVDAYPKFIETLGAPKALVSSPEGAFSCYVDAVTEQMGKSSYEPTFEPLADNVSDFLEQFAAY